METVFAAELRKLRHRSAISRIRLAERAGIALRTLAYWEAGERLPRIPELDAVLKVLEASAAERLHLLSLLNIPRGRQQARSEAKRSSSHPWVDAGDLLRAIRLRNGWTQAEAAQRLGIQRYTLIHWERGNSRISDEYFERFCTLMGVQAEERLALLAGRLTLPEWTAAPTLEVLADSVTRLSAQRTAHNVPLFDLTALAVKQQLSLHAAHSPHARGLLAQAELAHAYWLEFQWRQPEAKACLARTFALLEDESAPSVTWMDAFELKTHFMMYPPATKHTAIQRLSYDLISQLPESRRFFLLCDTAMYEQIMRDNAAAMRCLAQAEPLIAKTEDETEAENYFRLTAARIQVRQRASMTALGWLLDSDSGAFRHSQAYFDMINALIEHNAKREAQQYISLTQAALGETLLPQKHRQLEILTRLAT